MKKLLAMLLAAMMLLSLAACGGKDDPKPSGNSGTGDTPPASTQQEPATSDEGKGGATQKADGGQMAEETNEKYSEFLEMSGLASIGAPVGYTFDINSRVGQGRMLTFKADSGTIGEDDLAIYVKAVWNLCIDVADEGQMVSADGEVYQDISELGTIKKIQTIRYSLDGEKICIEFQAEEGEIRVQAYPAV